MRKILAATVAGIFFASVAVLASDTKGKTGAAPKTETKLVGEVICLSCYVDHESKGPEHAACAASCAKRGVPMGILEDKTGSVFMVVKGHTDPNEALQPFAGKRAALSGRWLERGGAKIFNLNTVAEAK
ncbi:MAG TPA: hypothetical protein VI546_03105 [candidate division Zixibacteria bacterium]|nr:hypothetical protein [candidate division Zixibacteria bacterium]